MNLDDLMDNPDLLNDGMEEFILNQGFNNSYLMLVLGFTLEEITSEGNIFFLAHNALGEYSQEDINHMLTYFENREEYEKCANVKKLLIN